MIFNMTGGGAGLNFKVSAYAELPETGKENEIAVITDAPITSWVFSPAEPEAPEEGMVWFSLGNNSPVPFNALKKNGIEIYPNAAKQYVDGAFVVKTAHIYQNEAWKDWRVYLFSRGVVNNSLTGGFNGTVTDEALYYEHSAWAGGNNANFTTKIAVDLTNANKMCIRYRSAKTSSFIYLRLFVHSTSANGEKITTDDYLAWTKTEGSHDGAEHVLELDVSEITGSEYVGYGWGISTSTSGSYSIEGYITEWWIE